MTNISIKFSQGVMSQQQNWAIRATGQLLSLSTQLVMFIQYYGVGTRKLVHEYKTVCRSNFFGGTSLWCAAISCHITPSVDDPFDFYAHHLKFQYHQVEEETELQAPGLAGILELGPNSEPHGNNRSFPETCESARVPVKKIGSRDSIFGLVNSTYFF